jgi:FtsZ-binding cell division protein ZapB
MDINDLLKKIQGVTNKDVEEAFDKAVEDAQGPAKGFEAFILVTDNQTAICGTGAELLALLAMVISDLAEKGLPKEEMIRAVDVAYLSDEELEKESEKATKKHKGSIEKLKKFLESIGEDEDDE